MMMMIPRIRFFLTVVTLLGAGIKDFGIATPADDKHNDDEVNHAEAQIEWVLSKGGFIHDGLEVQPVNKSDPKSAWGVFTSKDIPKGKTVVVIPKSCLLTSGGSGNTCDTVRNLVKQRKLGDDSDFAPYVRYLYDGNAMHPLPTRWSEKGREIIEAVVGKDLPTAGMITGRTYERACGKHTGDPFEEDEAYHYILQRSWDDYMVPIFDMINHRNGRWRNVDSTSAHDGVDLRVYTIRDIEAGEQLYLSYNEFTDCKEFTLEYVSQHIYMDFGFVEQYPQRWMFRPDDYDLVFEVDEKLSDDDEDGNEKELVVNWRSSDGESWGEPDTWGNQNQVVIRHLRGHLIRLQNLSKYVSEGVEQLESQHERSSITEFYQAMMVALKHAIWDAEDLIAAAAKGEEYIEDDVDFANKYDELEGERPDFEQFNVYVCDTEREWNRYGEYSYIDEVQSHYESFSFNRLYSDKDEDGKSKIVDTCLHIGNRLHVCSSVRPHYHEMLVHYPARFLDEPPRRVLFMGGGDNMVLHEVLKYPSLELVVGLELDQQIVRSSFKNFLTEPHWDNEKVEWWYGNCAASILLLPEDYYGSFDLVLLDLTSEVIESVPVTEDLSIMDAALLLLSPKGVIARNVDYGFDTTHRFTDYMLDVYDTDVPMFCYQGIKVGSNSADLLTSIPKDHSVETLYLKPVAEIENHFKKVYNYQKNTTHTLHFDSCCKEVLDNAKGIDAGVIMILEAEDALLLPMDSVKSLEASISQALKKAGLTQLFVKVSALVETGEGEGDMIVFILQEGYVVARTWSEHKYCAFDIQLWSHFDELSAVKNELLAAVGAKVTGKSSSSYRIVTTGMFGVSTGKEERDAVCPCSSKSNEEPVNPIGDVPVEQKQSTSDTVLAESLSLIQDANIAVVVLCGKQGVSCSTVEALTKKGARVLPIWTCPSIASDDSSSQVDHVCESDTLRDLKGFVQKNGKFNGIVIAPEAPRSMGQVFHKLLSSSIVRRQIFTENCVVLETSSPDINEATWRRALLDRFRTDFVRFDPAYRAEVFFNDTAGGLELGVFSGDHLFLSHLVNVIRVIGEKTGLVSEVRSVKNGRNNYVADFAPSLVASHDDYDHSSADEQWNSQKPLGRQTIFQFMMEERINDWTTSQAKNRLKIALGKTLRDLDYDDMSDAGLYDYSIGEGCVIVAFWSTGNAVLKWNGRAGVDINLFSIDEDQEIHGGFEEWFVENVRWPLEVVSRDEQPRGIGRVVNFKYEIDSYNEDLNDDSEDEVHEENEEEHEEDDDEDDDDKEEQEEDDREDEDDDDYAEVKNEL